MKINWKVRIKNKAFWLALIPALALVAQAVAALFGYTIDLGTYVGKLQALVNAVFAVLAILGIVVDPTTEGIEDSDRAMTYEKPWDDEAQQKKMREYIEQMSAMQDPDPEEQPCPPMPKGVEK